MADTHLMSVQPLHAALILTGQKRIEARLRNSRQAPFQRVQPGDAVFIKPIGQPTIAKAIVMRVDAYEGLTPEDIDRLKHIYNKRVLGDASFWDAKRDATAAIFLTLDKVRLIHDESIVPPQLLTPSRDTWRVLSDEQHRARAA